MITDVTPISMLDHAGLIGTARHGLRVSPAQIASRAGVEVEIAFDELGYFEFVGFSVPGAVIGFRMPRGAAAPLSYVSVLAEAGVDGLAEAARLAGVGRDEVVEFDTCW